MIRQRALALALGAAAFAGVGTVLLAPLGVSALAAEAPAAAGLQRSDLRFAGKLLYGSAAGGRVVLLVGGDEKEKAPRRLVELRLAADGAKLTTLATELPSTVEEVVAAPGENGTLVLVRDHRRVLTVDPSRPTSRREVAGAAGMLLGAADEGEIAPAPPWLAAGSAGEARRILLDGDAPRAGEPQGLPVTATLERWGLRLVSPAARFAGPWLTVGPLQEGQLLRTVVLGADGERREHTSALPEPERVADSAVVTLDGRPTLVVGTFRGLGVMSRKRLRVFALAGEPGAPPRKPLLARELSARAWQDITVRAGDFDNDGKDDLAIAAEEGLGGGDVTVTIFRGMGSGRLRAEPVQASLPVGEASWRYADVDGDRAPDLVTLGEGTLRIFASTASGLPAKKPSQSVKIQGMEDAPRPLTEVTISPGGATSRQIPPEPTPTPTPRRAASSPSPTPSPDEPRLPRPRWQLIDLDADAKSELIWWAPQPDGDTKMIVLRF